MGRAERVLWYLNFFATLVLLARMAYYKLHRAYPYIFLYWLSQIVASLLLLQIPMRSSKYAYAFFLAHFVGLVLAVLVIQELYGCALAAHPALSTFGRRSVLAVLAITAAVAAALTGLDATVLPGQYAAIHRFMTVSRTLEFMILVFFAAIGGFLLWFPVRIRRNIAVYLLGFFVFYAFQSLAFLLNNLLAQQHSQAISTAALAIALLCTMIWFVGLREEEAREAMVAGHSWNPAEAARLSIQLDQINKSLNRFVRTS